MAQKAAKAQSLRNTQILTRLHLTSICINLLYICLRWLRARNSLVVYLILSSPALFIQFWFEKIGRPSQTGDRRRSGEDLEAAGLTEYLWDVLYWTWGCIILVAIFGDKVWWAWTAVPVYSLYAAWKTFTGMRQGMGMGASSSAGGLLEDTGMESRRQKKLEKRAGLQTRFR